jgi:hypothetical protein
VRGTFCGGGPVAVRRKLSLGIDVAESVGRVSEEVAAW